MTEQQLQKYHAERKSILKEYRAKMLKTALLFTVIGLAALAAILAVCILPLDNPPLGLVVSLMVELFIVIYGWMRILVIKNALEKKLKEFEDQSLLQRNF